MVEIGAKLADLQERLFAQSTAGDRRRVLLILQGMDTSGKDGVVNHVLGMVNPGGIHLASFKKPTKEELEHDFLWRIEKQVPEPGYIGVFNRSQYEDVLVVTGAQPGAEPEVWSKRYAQINAFERRLTEAHVTDREVLPAHLPGHPEGTAAGPTGRPDEVLEIQPRRRRRTGVLGFLPGGLLGGTAAVQHHPGAVARHPVGSEVVPELGRRCAAAADPGGHRSRRTRRRPSMSQVEKRRVAES